MVKSKYVSVTQMCNDKSNDDLLREAIANFRKESPRSQEWERAFTKLWSLILKCKILATSPHPKYPDLLQEIQLEFSQRISSEFEQIQSGKKSLLDNLKSWINWYGLRLGYRIKDLYREENKKLQRETSLDTQIYSSNNDSNIPTLGDVIAGEFPELMETLIQEDFHEQLSAAIQKLDCHPKKSPQCTCGEIAQRRLLRNPPQKWEEMANELNVSQGTIAAHWKRKCKPLLQQIYNELSGGE
ncbi:MAG: sigma-70 family RNA polymerase sigma factor [Okeania sp. SIO3I5]|uniref:hypothetical protein n=1 Tax=Okeania sp. SIO3I5 TaxID=2607805 RepID=UPI0013BBD052|nr:hypothetical protein [Okeania sp. SIO3I5]NEQ40634.1 sigma-70 family RNA polymerase sigma factor [Okeania sp. SIO3I5]